MNNFAGWKVDLNKNKNKTKQKGKEGGFETILGKLKKEMKYVQNGSDSVAASLSCHDISIK